jgi:hypothetical protein
LSAVRLLDQIRTAGYTGRYSLVLWCRFDPRQDMAKLIDGLEGAFLYFGDVSQALLFDQMKAVITRDLRLEGGAIVHTAEFPPLRTPLGLHGARLSALSRADQRQSRASGAPPARQFRLWAHLPARYRSRGGPAFNIFPKLAATRSAARRLGVRRASGHRPATSMIGGGRRYHGAPRTNQKSRHQRRGGRSDQTRRFWFFNNVRRWELRKGSKHQGRSPADKKIEAIVATTRH